MTNDRSKITVVRDGTVWTGGKTPELVYGHDLIAEDGSVVAIEPGYQGRVDVEVDGAGCLVIPGLINAHVHPGTTPRSRGLAEDVDIPNDGAFYHVTLPVQLHAKDVLTPADLVAVMTWDLIAMLAGGATTIVAEQFGPWRNWLDLVEQIGFRCHYGLTYPNNLSAIGYVEDGKIVHGASEDIAATLSENLTLHDRFHGAFSDRLRIHLSPHGPDTVPEDLLRETTRHCRERGINAHLHLAQHQDERSVVAKLTGGKTSIEYLDDIGFLGEHVMATHVTYIEDGDIPILARSGTHVVHASYRKAKEGVASPFWPFLAAGVNVAIATDSFSHDLIQDLRLAAMIGKIREGRVGHPTAREVLRCATFGAAHALGRPDLGHLNPGAKADITVINLTSPFNAPVLDPIRAMIYYSSASDIRCTIVDGEVLYQDGTIVGCDIDAVRAQAADACHRLWQAAADGGVMPVGTDYRGCGH